MTREYILSALRKRNYRVVFLSNGKVELFHQRGPYSPKLFRGIFRSLTAAYKQVRIWSQLANQESDDLPY